LPRVSSVERVRFALEYGPKYKRFLRWRSRVKYTRGNGSSIEIAM
jgi:hypothetical protein